MDKRGYSDEDRAAKLAHYDQLKSEGKLHKEMPPLIGVSGSTLSGWLKKRKEESSPKPKPVATNGTGLVLGPDSDTARLKEALAENTRLRRLVTDVLLGNVKLARKTE